MHTLRDPDATVAHGWDGGLATVWQQAFCVKESKNREAFLRPGWSLDLEPQKLNRDIVW